tara:strand:- start:41 stop:988 length:948 start_codon:yes stop_codon:yes gene_type:complete
MSTQYLKFRGYNVTSQQDSLYVPGPGGDEGTFTPNNVSSIENTRNLVVKKEDIVNIYSYIPENANIEDPAVEGQPCDYCRACLSFRVNLALKNMGLVELQVVSEVPVNNIFKDGSNIGFFETASDKRALTIPFESWLLNNDNGFSCFNADDSPYNCLNEDTNAPAPGITVVPPINGIQYQWTQEAIKAYFGIFDDPNWGPNGGTSPGEIISRWLEEKVSKYLTANPGGPITEVVLGEVKDFTYDDGKNGPVTYGGFKLRFGGIGMPCVINYENPNTGVEEYVLNQKVFSNSLPFKYSDRRIGSTVGGNIPVIPEP